MVDKHADLNKTIKHLFKQIGENEQALGARSDSVSGLAKIRQVKIWPRTAL
jgi:hypothetical protein